MVVVQRQAAEIEAEEEAARLVKAEMGGLRTALVDSLGGALGGALVLTPHYRRPLRKRKLPVKQDRASEGGCCTIS